MRLEGVLAITSDVKLYSSVSNAAGSSRWRIRWARTLTSAIEIQNSDWMPIIVYDSSLPEVEWPWALDCFAEISNLHRVFLVAPAVDECLWKAVRRHHGYDVIDRSAKPDDFERVFRFAWLSIAERSLFNRPKCQTVSW